MKVSPIVLSLLDDVSVVDGDGVPYSLLSKCGDITSIRTLFRFDIMDDATAALVCRRTFKASVARNRELDISNSIIVHVKAEHSP
jgi:hypothetical protein